MQERPLERLTEVQRSTKETDLHVELNLSQHGPHHIELGIPFLEHMLHAMAFHGGFALTIRGTGDLQVDAHHLVEDTGIVLGDAFRRIFASGGPVERFGSALIPMDDALSEAVIDVCERAYLVYDATYPQEYSGDFQMSLVREFFLAFVNHAQINLHLSCRYGLNSHHMSESLFKAFGKALGRAYASTEGKTSASMSTKGVL